MERGLRASHTPSGSGNIACMCEPEAQRAVSGRLSRRGFLASAARSTAALQFGLAAQASQNSTSSGGGKPIENSTRSTVLNVNGEDRTLNVEARVTLLDALRDRLGLTGTKKGCDQGTCGACTVLANDRRILSCLTLAVMHAGERITTIEGVGRDERLHPLQKSFVEHDGFQCGYCTPGQIVSAVGLLNEGVPLDRAAIAEGMSGNLCRCGCYSHIVDAIVAVSGRP